MTTRHGEFSEVMICDAEDNYSISRLVLDNFSEFLYTTKAKEFAQIKDLTQRGVSITDAIEKILKNRKSNE